MNEAEAIVAFMDAMHADGVDPDESIGNQLAAGEFVRFRCKDERKANGWARLFLDGRPAGRYGNHRLGIDATWKADAEPTARTLVDRAAFRAKADADRKARERQKADYHELIADQATAMIGRADLPDPTHPYLLRKRVPGEGLFQIRDMLLAPMRDVAGRIWNVQRIFGDGAKLFLKGGRVEGLFWLAGDGERLDDLSYRTLCIGEGVATVKAVRRATGHDVIAAFSKQNLEPVAHVARSLWPDRPITICADDDAHLVHNPRIRRNLGVDAARAAAAAIGARVALPPRSIHHG